MRINTINVQIVRNLGNYETLRIGAEWTPDSNQTIADAMAAGLAELNATADLLTGKSAADQAAPAQAEQKQEQAPTEQKQAPAPAAQAEKEPEPDALDVLNATKEGDQREVLTLAAPKKFNNILGRIAAGVEVSTVFNHFRFDADTLNILRAAASNTRYTIAFGDAAFSALIKAVEERKDITNICEHIQFADQNAANAWELATKLN